jgi:glycosyltransferase involved in cell wall biosynthesis
MISVVTACFNGEEFILPYLQSINSQKISFELVFIDDGSSDNTLKIFTDFEFQPHVKVKLISRPNRGFHYSLIEGISQAENSWIARLDVDDIWLPTHLFLLKEYISQNKNIVLLGTSANIINSSNEQIHTVVRDFDNKKARRYLLKDNPFFHSSVIFSKEAYLQTNGYDFGNTPSAILMADYFLWVQLSIIGSIRILPSVNINYRVLDNSMSRKVNRVENYKSRLEVMKYAYNSFGENGLYSCFWRTIIYMKLLMIEFFERSWFGKKIICF